MLPASVSVIFGLLAALLALDAVVAGARAGSSGTVARAPKERASACSGTKTPPDRGPPPAIPAGRYFMPGSPQRRTLREPGMRGVLLTLSGRVYDENCKPVARALLDFFQADSHGKYDRKEIRLHGHQYTGARGGYLLRTIVPNHYLRRPPHIHVGVQAYGPVLETQLFFPGKLRAYGMHVAVLNAHDRAFRPALTVRLGPRQGNRYAATFDFVIAVNP